MRRWIPVLLYVGVIFALSSIHRPPPLLPIRAQDKVMHVIEYGGLGWLLLWTLRPHLIGLMRAAVLTLALGSVVATLDELYQSTVPGRFSTVSDVVADVAGLLLAVLVWSTMHRRTMATRDVAARNE